MSKIIILGTPLGNIEDISIRAIKTIFTSKFILAEDTRTFIKLKNLVLDKLPGIMESLNLSNNKPELISYREQNHERVISKVINLLDENNDLVLTTDNGMPAISDPGYRLIADAIKSGHEIEVIPGPTAVDSALVLSGLPTDRFTFLGFLPRKGGKAKKILETYLNDENSLIIFESPYRVIKLLENIKTNFGDKINVSASNDITKKFEKTYRGSISEVTSTLKQTKIVGEWVIIIRKQD